MKYVKGGDRKFIIFIIIVLMVAAGIATIFGFNCQTGGLTVYNDNETETIKDFTTEEETTTEQIELVNKDFSDYGFSIGVPEGWTEVTKSGFQTFVHQETGSAIQIQALDYDPSINNMDSTTISAELTEDGKTFMNFNKYSTSAYELMYQDLKDTTYDYLDETQWDRKHIIRMVLTCDDEVYDDMKNYFQQCYNSLNWYDKDPIPDNVALYYLEGVNAEFAYPSTWILSSSSDVLIAADTETQTNISLSCQGYDGKIEDLTGMDLLSLFGSDKNGFTVSSFEKNEDDAYVSASYVENSIQYQLRARLVLKKGTLFIITYVYEDGLADTETLNNCLTLFRAFGDKKFVSNETDANVDTDTETENQTETTSATTSKTVTDMQETETSEGTDLQTTDSALKEYTSGTK